MSLVVRCGECSRTFRVRQHPGDRRVPCQGCGQPLDFSPSSRESSLLSLLPFLMWGGLATTLLSGATGVALLFSWLGPDKVPGSPGATARADPNTVQSFDGMGNGGHRGVPTAKSQVGGRAIFTVQPVPVREVVELQEIRVPSPISLAGSSRTVIRFSLTEPPPDGVRLDPRTGDLTWTPNEDQGPGEYTIAVTAHAGSPPSEQQVRIPVRVLEANTPPDLARRAAGRVLRVPAGEIYVADFGGAQDRDRPRNRLKYRLIGALPGNTTFDADTAEFRWQPPESLVGSTLSVTVVVSDNGEPPLSSSIRYQLRVVMSSDTSEVARKPVASATPKSLRQPAGWNSKWATDDSLPAVLQSRMNAAMQLARAGELAKSLLAIERVIAGREFSATKPQVQRAIVLSASSAAHNLGREYASDGKTVPAHAAYRVAGKHFRVVQKKFQQPLSPQEEQLGALVMYHEAFGLADKQPSTAYASLAEAVKLGFDDFERMRNEKGLAPLHRVSSRFGRFVLQQRQVAAARKAVVRRPLARKPGARKPGPQTSKDAACGLCSGNGINACPTRACKNGYQKIRGNKYPCGDCLGFGRIPCRACPDLGKKRRVSLDTIKAGRTYFANMQTVASRNRFALSSINSLRARNRYIDRKLDDDDTPLSRVSDLAKEKSLNELKIKRFGDELPGLLILFAQAKTAVSRSVQRQATLISEGQSSGFQFSIKKRLGEVLKVIKAL